MKTRRTTIDHMESKGGGKKAEQPCNII